MQCKLQRLELCVVHLKPALARTAASITPHPATSKMSPGVKDVRKGESDAI